MPQCFEFMQSLKVSRTQGLDQKNLGGSTGADVRQPLDMGKVKEASNVTMDVCVEVEEDDPTVAAAWRKV